MEQNHLVWVISVWNTCIASDAENTDFVKYVGPMVKSERNLTGPIKPTFFSDQMSAIVQDQISVFTNVRSGFPRFSSVAWFNSGLNILTGGLFSYSHFVLIEQNHLVWVIIVWNTCIASDAENTDFVKYVGPTVKSDRNLTGPIKPTFFSDQMSAIVQDQISVFTNVRSGFPSFSSVAWFPVKVKFLMEGLFHGKKRMVDTSDGAERKRNQKYGANRVKRTLIEQWKTGQPWLLLSVLWHTCVH